MEYKQLGYPEKSKKYDYIKIFFIKLIVYFITYIFIYNNNKINSKYGDNKLNKLDFDFNLKLFF